MNIILLLICFVEFVRDISECCEVGHFGESCSDVCPKYCHNNECDRISGICLSCVKGYYSKNETCIQCPGNCEACDSNNVCFTCKNGFRGTVCDYLCSNCKPNTSCDKITGYCLESCSDGLSGELCDIHCDLKCKSCDRYYQHECTSCEDDESGVSCKENCFSRCLKRICNDSDESCTFDCLSENWEGKSCNKTCLTYCKDRVCNITCDEKERKGSPMLENNINIFNIIVGIGVGSVVLIALCIIIIWIVRRHSYKLNIRCCTTKTHFKSKEDQIEGNDDDVDIDSSSKPLNPTAEGLTNLSLPMTAVSNRVKCYNIKNDTCSTVEKLGSCDNPIFINGDGLTERYIASFGPVETFINGFDVFWKMVWEEQCGKVVVLSSNDAEDRKFDEYFSSKQQHDEFTVEGKNVRKFGKTKYRRRDLTVKSQTKKRKVALFHFLAWPDEGVPNSSILDFQKKVNAFSTKLTSPTVVHLSSAGKHRTATYIALDILTKKNKLVNKDDVMQCIANLEKHRLEVIFEQIWKLACLANITQSSKSDVDITQQEVHSNEMNKSRTTRNVNPVHNSVDTSVSAQKTLCNNKDQRTPKTTVDFKSKETEV